MEMTKADCAKGAVGLPLRVGWPGPAVVAADDQFLRLRWVTQHMLPRDAPSTLHASCAPLGMACA
jgi:hypothetical protein